VPKPVVIVDYDPRWSLTYEEERRRILAIAGCRILGVEHIGSTAVVGLGAKPIVDIMVGINGLSDANKLLPLLRKIGYESVTRQQDDSGGYYCLDKVVHGEGKWLQNFHLHLMKFRSVTWQRHILFRDFLRDHSETAQRYDELKRRLAAEFGVDRENYTKAKTEFIASVITQVHRQ
jgi:GrpB-like predicted nucleotidyltransferase (UPF0157 family)